MIAKLHLRKDTDKMATSRVLNLRDENLHRELGKISATLDEILRRLDRHAENEEKLDIKLSRNEQHMQISLEKINMRVSGIESRLNYGLGALAALVFIFEIVMKLIKVG